VNAIDLRLLDHVLVDDGVDLALFVEQEGGRTPVKAVNLSAGVLRWERADGLQEGIDLSGQTESLERARQMLAQSTPVMLVSVASIREGQPLDPLSCQELACEAEHQQSAPRM